MMESNIERSFYSRCGELIDKYSYDYLSAIIWTTHKSKSVEVFLKNIKVSEGDKELVVQLLLELPYANKTDIELLNIKFSRHASGLFTR